MNLSELNGNAETPVAYSLSYVQMTLHSISISLCRERETVS